MSEPQPIYREWFIEAAPAEARIRCRFQRRGKQVEHYTVQLEIFHLEDWHPIVRYDNAHGFSHRDVLHVDGTQDKTPIHVGDLNESFTLCD